MSVAIKLRRGTAAEWTSANPILAVGEPGFETDTKQIKIGDGATAWTSLPYFTGGISINISTGVITVDGNTYDLASQAELSGHVGGTDPHGDRADAASRFVPLAQRGVANGVATLDSGGTIPDAQIPSGIARDTEVSAAVAALVNSAPSILDTLGEIDAQLQSDESAAAALTTAVAGKQNVVVHGATASTARPSGATLVHWVGSVAPTNAATNDEWTDTVNKLLKRWTGSVWDALGSGASVGDLTDRTSAVSETVPAGATTNATTAGVTLTAPALSNPVGTIPQRFAVRNASTGTVTVSYPVDPSGTVTSLTVLAGEVLTFRQKSLAGWAAESGNKPLASLSALFKTPVASRSPLVAKTRGTVVIPNTWTNTAQKAYPENAVWDPDTNQYVGVYMAEQQTPSAFSLVCYWTAPSLAAIKAGQLTDGGVVSGMGAGGQTPHLMREGAFWYIFAANTSVTNIDIWRSSTSPAGAGAFSKVQTGIITRGSVASISTPAAPTVTPTTGAPGSIAAGTGSYKVSALTAAGETTAGSAGSGTLASSGYYTVTWSAITGATGYNVYKQTAPGNLYLLVGTVSGNATTTYQDNTGTPLSAQQPMLSNVSASFDLTLALEQYVVRIPTRDPLWAQGYRYAMYYMGQSTATGPEQVGVAVSATLNATGWTKLNGGNPVIPASGGYANDSEGSADPFVWFAPNGKIVVFYVAIEAGGVGKTMHWHYAAAVADQISGPYTKLGTVIETPCYPDVGQGGSATWSTGTYPRMAQMNGNEGGVWRGSFLRNDIDNEVLWMHAGKNMTGVGNTTTTVAGFLDTFDLASPLLRGIVAVEPWERVEVESNDPRWVLSGTWTNQSTSEWSGGTMKFSTTTNDTATFHFEGIAVRVGLAAMNNMGIVEMWVDGVYDRTLDLYNPGATNHSPVTYEKLGLTPGAHKVMVKIVGKNTVSSNSVVVVDYAEVLGSGVGL